MEKRNAVQLYKTLQNCTEIGEYVFDRSVLSIKKTEGSEVVIVLLLQQMQEALVLDNQMTAVQLQECAREIIREYPHFKLQDIQVFCHGCKFGRYGKAYNRLNGQILFEWLAAFDEKRVLKIQADRKKEQQKRAGELDESGCHEWLDMSAIYERAREEQREKVKKRLQRQDKAAFAAERERQIEELKKRS